MNAEPNTSKPLEWPNYGPVNVGSKPRQITRNVEESPHPESERSRLKSQALWLALVAVVSAQTGCASSTTTYVKADVPETLSQPCPSLQELTGSDGGSVLLYVRYLISTYNDCSYRFDAYREAVK